MKIKITQDYDYRVRPAVVQHFRAPTEVNVPKKTAEALIEAGAATPVPAETKE